MHFAFVSWRQAISNLFAAAVTYLLGSPFRAGSVLLLSFSFFLCCCRFV